MFLKHTIFIASLALLACDQRPPAPSTKPHLTISALSAADPARIAELRARVLAAHPDDPRAEHPGDAPSGVILDWERSSETTHDGRVRFNAINLDDTPAELRVTAIGDLATLASRELGTPTDLLLAPNTAQAFELQLDPAKAASLEYSGFFAVHVSACPLRESGELDCRSAVSAARFFHPSDEGLEIYDETTLASKHHNGDFAGRSDLSQVPGTFRVMGGGPLHTPPPLEREERAPVELPVDPSVPEVPAVPANTANTAVEVIQ